jgi:hypothetical protein
MTPIERRRISLQLWADVKKYCEETGATVQGFARRCGLPERALEMIAQGKTRQLNDRKIQAVGEYLGKFQYLPTNETV